MNRLYHYLLFDGRFEDGPKNLDFLLIAQYIFFQVIFTQKIKQYFLVFL